MAACRGGTIERPALQRLLEDIKAGKVQIVVVYKVDRLTRSLADFAKIVDVFDAHDASFVSVTQQFNTTTSMGRLTLNMLLSFAQFEREIAGERIRDKIAASKRKGMWMGGNLPLGYDVVDRKLIINDAEAETVRFIFRRYAELETVSLLRLELGQIGIVSKRRVGASGTLSGGKRFSRGGLYALLQNRLYHGEIAHRGETYPGQHEAIVDEVLWQTVQDKLSLNRRERSLGVGVQAPSLLAGVIVDADGNRLTPTHANKKGKRYRYYTSAPSNGTGRNNLKILRLPAGEVEALVLDRIRLFFSSQAEIVQAIGSFEVDARTFEFALHQAGEIAQNWTTKSPLEIRELVQTLVSRVSIDQDRIDVFIDSAELAATLGARDAGLTKCVADIVLATEATLHRVGKGKRLLIGGVAQSEINTELVDLMKFAFSVRQALLSGMDDSIEAMTNRLGVRRGHLSAVCRLTYLSPDIVRDCMAGRQPRELTPTWLLKLGKDLPHDWPAQRSYLGFAD